MPGSDKVDTFIPATSTEIKASRSPNPGPILMGNRDAEVRSV